MSPSIALYIVGSFLVFGGERIFGANDTVRWAMDALGTVLALTALAMRSRTMATNPRGTRLALMYYAVSISSIVYYIASTRDVVAMLGLEEETSRQVRTALQCAVPLQWLIGAWPAFALDRTLTASPHSAHPLRVRAALDGGLAVALGLAMLFPINWLAKEFNERWDFGYYRTTKVGSATEQIVENLDEPMTAVLFWPSSNEVLEEVRVYFDDLKGPNLTVEVMDKDLDPEKAKEWKVRDNGTIALIKGEDTETVKIGDKIDTAKKELRKLDSKVQTALLKLAREKRNAYFTVGHEELYWKNAANDEENVDVLKKGVESLNFKVKELGAKDGLAQAVPDDAALVFITGPKQPFLPEEVAALKTYRDGGGALFLMLRPMETPDPDLLALFGVTSENALVITDKTVIKKTGGLTDRQYIITNKFSSHESVTTLSKNSSQLFVITPGAVAIKEAENHAGKVTITVKGMTDWFKDLNGNWEFDKDAEKRGGCDIGAIASGPSESGGEWRAAVLGSASMASNLLLSNAQFAGNTLYLRETIGWLTADPALGGETATEEDVKIQHTKENEAWWFYGSSVVLPAGVLFLGLTRVSRRRKQGAA
jgi:hypothetical protein